MQRQVHYGSSCQLERHMMEYRWLLPFTYGIDHNAIETVVRMADAGGSTLVSVALIPISSGRRPSGTRLEAI